MDQASGAHVYQGLWVNWKYGQSGAIITFSARSGGMLTALLVIFEVAAFAALWRTLAFLGRQLRTSEGPRMDSMTDSKSMFIVRKVGTTGATSRWWLARRPVWLSLLLVLLALANLAAFAYGVTYYLGANIRIGDEVLLRSDNCGYWMANKSLSDATRHSAVMRKTSKDTMSAASYARSCYGCASDGQLCNQYVKRKIKYTGDPNATCPFARDICLNGTAAFSLDTGYMSSLDSLGFNTRKADHILYRRKTTCAPITDEGYIIPSTWKIEDTETSSFSDDSRSGGVIDFYMYGPRRSMGTISNRPSNSTFYYFREAANIVVDAYGLRTPSFSLGNGMANDWFPIDALRRRDADISIMFLERNGIAYVSPVYDPVFEATSPFRGVDRAGTIQNWYSPDSFASVLVCIDQHQICNPNNGLCNELVDYARAAESAQSPDLGLNPVQSALAKLLALDLPFETISGIIGTRGAGALRAQELVHNGVSAPLRCDQWMYEVENWFATGLARLQQHFVQLATGPSSLGEGLYPTKPQDPITQMLCNAQKVHSTGATTNFSTFGLVHLLAAGAFLCDKPLPRYDRWISSAKDE